MALTTKQIYIFLFTKQISPYRILLLKVTQLQNFNVIEKKIRLANLHQSSFKRKPKEVLYHK